MRVSLPQELEDFRGDVRSWLHRQLPADWSGSLGDEDEDWNLSVSFIQALGRRGWNAPSWPEEVGGGGLSVWKSAVLSEETGFALAPTKSTVISVGFAGPTIRLYGTGDQKERFLRPIARGEQTWCQAFSEPDAGSDLASLRTTAVKDGDTYIINGRKIWTSFAHRAQWMILLARTDPSVPKHKGITYFIIPVDSPGISIYPLVNIAGNHRFNEVVFENVRVPVDSVLGNENGGWYVATATLDLERSSISTFGLIRRKFEDALAGLKAAPEFARAGRRARAADIAIAIQVGRMQSYRVVEMQSRGLLPSTEASQAKLFASEINQRVSAFQLDARAMAGQIRKTDPRVVNESDPVTSYLEAVAATIAGGTSEVQRNIIATRGLGLPRGE